MEDLKLIALFSKLEGQPVLLGDEVSQCGDKEVCLACPLRAGNLVVESLMKVPITTKAVSGSEKAGLKLVKLDCGLELPACFHPARSSLIQSFED
jgi:hypothetical protein